MLDSFVECISDNDYKSAIQYAKALKLHGQLEDALKYSTLHRKFIYTGIGHLTCKYQKSVEARYKMGIAILDITTTKKEREALLKPIVDAQFSQLPLRYLTHMMQGDYQTVPSTLFEAGTLERIKFLALNATTRLQCTNIRGSYTNHDIIRGHLSWNMERAEIGRVNQARSRVCFNTFNDMIFLNKKNHDYPQIVQIYDPNTMIEEGPELRRILGKRDRLFCIINSCCYFLLFAFGFLAPALLTYVFSSSLLFSAVAGIGSLGILLASTGLYFVCKSCAKATKIDCPDCVENFVDMVRGSYKDSREDLAARFV